MTVVQPLGTTGEEATHSTRVIFVADGDQLRPGYNRANLRIRVAAVKTLQFLCTLAFQVCTRRHVATVSLKLTKLWSMSSHRKGGILSFGSRRILLDGTVISGEVESG